MKRAVVSERLKLQGPAAMGAAAALGLAIGIVARAGDGAAVLFGLAAIAAMFAAVAQQTLP